METNKESGQVEIVGPFGRVYLYTSHNRKELVKEVYEALSLRKRWNDPDYLARIMFCRMVPIESWAEEIGYGIGTQLYGDVELLVTLDTTNLVITIQVASDLLNSYSLPFSEFVDTFYKLAEI